MAHQKQHKQLILTDSKNISTKVSNQYNVFQQSQSYRNNNVYNLILWMIA